MTRERRKLLKPIVGSTIRLTAMVVFNDVIQVLVLSGSDRRGPARVEGFWRGRVGAALLCGDSLWFSILATRFLEMPARSLDAGLIRPPALAYGVFAFAKRPFEQPQALDCPPMHVLVIALDSPLAIVSSALHGLSEYIAYRRASNIACAVFVSLIEIAEPRSRFVRARRDPQFRLVVPFVQKAAVVCVTPYRSCNPLIDMRFPVRAERKFVNYIR
jgi:hypothetical protein